MPRQARLDAPGTLHHVMIRGIDDLELFRDDQDRENFISRISQLVKSTGTKILAWALMDNHVHLLMSSGHQAITAWRSLEPLSFSPSFQTVALGEAFLY